MSYTRRKSRGDSVDSRSRGSSIDERSRNDSIDTRSYSFDSADCTNVNKTDTNTKAIFINRRKREQTIDIIIPSPVPDKFKYFIGINNDNLVGHPTEIGVPQKNIK